jgi:glutathione S-transferase
MITVHHLNRSRSHRVLWMLEELELLYELKRYERSENHARSAGTESRSPVGQIPRYH